MRAHSLSQDKRVCYVTAGSEVERSRVYHHLYPIPFVTAPCTWAPAGIFAGGGGEP